MVALHGLALPNAHALGTALRAARKHLGLTQPQLALAAGVGVRFLVELEAGKPTVRLDKVLRVVDVLGGSLYLEGLPMPNALGELAMQGGGCEA